MRARLEELGWADTPLGTLVLRRRLDPVLERDVYEVRLGDEYLMSSLFTAGEVELARLGLSDTPGSDLDVAVAGLGLGYTARAALEDRRVRSLTVVEALPEVIAWHRGGLLPEVSDLASDRRVRFVEGDFFALVARGEGLDPSGAVPRFHALLVDIDHSPRHVLSPTHAPFYRPEGLRRLARHLHEDGVLALWSDDPPDPAFQAALQDAFASAGSHVVEFANPLTAGVSANTVYVGRRVRGGDR